MTMKQFALAIVAMLGLLAACSPPEAGRPNSRGGREYTYEEVMRSGVELGELDTCMDCCSSDQWIPWCDANSPWGGNGDGGDGWGCQRQLVCPPPLGLDGCHYAIVCPVVAPPEESLLSVARAPTGPDLEIPGGPGPTIPPAAPEGEGELCAACNPPPPMPR